MTAPDPLDVARARLSGHVDAAVLDSAIAEVRARFGGKRVHIKANCQARHLLILAALASGATDAEVARKFGLTVQAIGYIRRKKHLTGAMPERRQKHVERS